MSLTSSRLIFEIPSAEDFMANQYKNLSYNTLVRGTKINRRTQNRQTSVSLNNPATIVMTDFSQVSPFSIEPTASIDQTNAKMIACGVRLLFVLDNTDGLIGLITASDVLGEKPVKYIQERGGIRQDIMAKDIMTPHDKLQALQMADIENACVGDIVETMKTFGRQHILVVEKDQTSGTEYIQGLFSTSQIERQLQMNIELSNRAASFAELEKALLSA